MLLMAVVHRTVKNANHDITYTDTFHIQWSAGRQSSSLKVPVNCVKLRAALVKVVVAVRSVSMQLCVQVLSTEWNLYCVYILVQRVLG
jgi:hypothetical protein